MGTTRWRTAPSAVEDALRRVYDRYGPLGLTVVGFGTASLACAVVCAVVILATAGHAGVAVRELIPFAGSGVLFMATAFALGLLASRHVVRLWLSWSGAGRSAHRAVEVWNASLELPRVLVIRCCLFTYVLLLINYALMFRALELPGSAFLPLAVGNALMVAACGVAVMLYLEFALRPGTADVARYLPADFRPGPPRLALRTKAILPIPGLALFTAFFISGLIDTSLGFAAQLTRGISLTLVIILAAVALFYVLAHAVLDPIDQLTDATRRVGAGDLDARVPVVSADELGGLASSFNQMLEGLRERERLRAHNVQLSTALEESLEEVRASRARIVAAADDERRRMERDLHDGAQQRLVMISLKLAMAADLIGSDPAAAAVLHEELRADAAKAVDELRDLAHGIYPPLLESDGIASALEDVADQSAMSVTVENDGTGRYPAPLEAAVYFCCLEALQNAAKYAGPGTHAQIHLSQTDGVLHFLVSDDGRGFDMPRVSGHVGLQNMADRIGALGGMVTVTSSPGLGTTVQGTVPL